AVDVVEAMPALADVPLGHGFVEERHHELGGVRRLVAIEELVGFGFYGCQTRKGPAIQQRPARWRGVLLGRGPAEVRILGENAGVHVLEREQKSPGGVANS